MTELPRCSGLFASGRGQGGQMSRSILICLSLFSLMFGDACKICAES